MSVSAVLTMQFARTIALALTVADFSKKFADRVLLPIVERATPEEYRVITLGGFANANVLSVF